VPRRAGPRPLRILISSGPTREPLDPVRFLSNYSTGYMGARLADAALARGHRVTVVSGPAEEPLPRKARVIRVEQAHEMARALRRLMPRADALIMAAAVSDFRVPRPRRRKRPRADTLTLTLRATPEVVGRLPRRAGQVVAGFALESGAVVPRARRKLRRKRLDVVLAQHVRSSAVLRPERSRRTQPATRGRAPFGRRPVRAWLIERGGRVRSLGVRSKPALARALLDKVEALWYGQRGFFEPS